MTTTTPAWVGWLEIDLHPYVPARFSTDPDEPLPARSWSSVGVVTVDVSVRMDIVSFWLGSRTLAVADRDQLAAWVQQPDRPLLVDDLEFAVIDGQLCLSVDRTGPYALATSAVSDMVRVLLNRPPNG